MGLPLEKFDFSDRPPTSDETDSARDLLELLEPLSKAASPAEISVTHCGNSETYRVAPGMARVLADMLRHFAAGRTVTLVPVGATLTTQQAADLLNVSRPYIVKLIEKGELGATKIGRHRRLEANEVLAYKRDRDRRREEALDALIAADSEHF